MSWNYRVVEFESAEGEKYFEVKEVFYNRDGKPVGYSDAVVSGESYSELMQIINMIKRDVLRPVIKESEFFSNEPKDKDAE